MEPNLPTQDVKSFRGNGSEDRQLGESHTSASPMPLLGEDGSLQQRKGGHQD